MEFLVQDGAIQIVSHKKNITLDTTNVLLDGMAITCAGEYEKSGFLLYVKQWNQKWVYHFRVEGYWIAYIPDFVTEIDSDTINFLGQIDILVMPAGKSSQKVIEQIEPKMLVTYGEKASEVPALFGENFEPVTKYKVKASDISVEKTSCVTLDIS
ncbi:hypothetical protein CSB09_04805 [Candidatus Gracilibacteria bacterium]|nr:MAG: hypothetical protein CSB09_04805 [Candidatus Gracilibacteria bacterium]